MSVPSMSAYVACHACHKETTQSNALAVTNTQIPVSQEECIHSPMTKRKASEEHSHQGGLLRAVLGHALHPLATSTKTEASLDASNSPILSRITLRIRNFSGDSNDSKEK